MTIDEAIAHCLEVAEEQSRLYSLCPCPCNGTDNCMSLKNGKDMGCTKCATEHRQLAEWLLELKEAKRLLKAAMSDLAEAEPCSLCKYEADDIASCQSKPANCFVWRYADEAEKLLNDEK